MVSVSVVHLSKCEALLMYFSVAGASETAVDRRERLRKLALETIDLAKDPYILRSVLVLVTMSNYCFLTFCHS